MYLDSLTPTIVPTEATTLLVSFLLFARESHRSQHVIVNGLPFFLTKDYTLTLLGEYHPDKRRYLIGLRLAVGFNFGKLVLYLIGKASRASFVVC